MRTWALVVALALSALPILGQQTPSFTLDIKGQQTWTVKFGFGDPGLLRAKGISPGQPLLDQHLTATVKGTAYRIITVSGNFDSKLGPVFQDFKVSLDGRHWKGLIGKFSLEGGGLASPRSLMGVKLGYFGDSLSIEGIASRAQGIPEVKVFKGTTEKVELLFSLRDPNAPWRPAPYSRNLHGLFFWKLQRPFVPGFTEVVFALEPTSNFLGVLREYGLDYLAEEFPEGFSRGLEEGKDFLVLEEGGKHVLLLAADPRGLVRDGIRDAIDDYNEKHGLSGDEAKRYPFARDSELEDRFLGELLGIALVRVDQEEYPLGSARSDRYLRITREVVPGSLSLSIRGPGEEGFRGLPPGYSTHFFPDQGILRLDFPEDFFRDDAALKVSFTSPRGTTVFNLGAAVVPGSERVYRDGKLLKRGVDYSIDYQMPAIITLFKGLTERETLRVEFERARGELGGFAPYQRDILGLTLSFPSGARIRLLRAADEGRPSPSTAVMPNTHTVGGLELSGKEGEWDYQVVLGASENVYPPGDNERIPARNRIEAIAVVEAPDGEYVVFGHHSGITVYHGGTFSSYSQELGGRAVNALLYLPEEGKLLCGTNGGLTVVDLSLESPFDWVSSYRTIRREEGGKEGLPGREVLALAACRDGVLLATGENLVRIPAGALLEPGKWEKPVPLPSSVRPTALLCHDGLVFLGTDRGLFRLAGGEWEAVMEAPWPVRDLALDPTGGILYVATPEGVRLLDPAEGRGLGWIGYGRDVHALSLLDGELFYGARAGLFRADGEEPLAPGPVTALWARYPVLWVGREADADYRLVVSRWQGAMVEDFPQDITHIPGEDTSRYSDIPPAGHTARGITAAVRLSRELPLGDLRLRLESVWPGFQGIGMAGKADVHGLGLSLSFGKGSLQGDLGADLWVRDLFSRPEREVRGRISLRWNSGATLSLDLSPSYLVPRDGAPRLLIPYGLTISQEVPIGSLTLGTNGQGVWQGKWELRGDVTGKLRLTPIEGGVWTVDVSLRGPYSVPARRGSWTLKLSSTFRHNSPGGMGWTLSWVEDMRDLLGPGFRGTREISLKLARPEFTLWGMEITPSLTPSFMDDGRSWSLTLGGRLGIEMDNGGVRLDLDPDFTLGRDRRSGTWRQLVRIGLGLRPLATGLGRLEVRSAVSLERLYHPRYGERLSLGWDLRATLRLEGIGPGSTVSLSWGKEELSVRAELRSLGPIGELGSPDLRLELSLRGGKLKGEVSFDLSRALGGGWGLSLQGGYLFSLGKGWKQAGYLQLNANVNF